MKKLLAAMIFAALLLAGCAAETDIDVIDSAEENSLNPNIAADTSEPEAWEGFALTYRDIRLLPGAAADIEALLGEPDSKIEAPSCIHEGNDILYCYDGIEIATSPSSSGAYITSIAITGEAASTEESISLGDTIDDAKNAYGDAESEAFGRYLFLRGSTSLTLMTDGDGYITAISYAYVE